MKRREFITLLGSAAAGWPFAARAQQGERVRRIGILQTASEDDPVSKSRVAAFEHGLQATGWIAGRNIQLDYRWGGANTEETRALAKELVRVQPDAIVGAGSEAIPALLQETRVIPVVFLQVSDPVGLGFVSNLARPGGNVTGFTNFEFSMGGKWLELLKEIAPGVSRVAVMLHPASITWTGHLPTVQVAASSFGVRTTPAPVESAVEIEYAIDTFARDPNGGLIVLPSPFMTRHRELIAALLVQHRLPSVWSARFYAASGGLISYGIDPTEPYRQAAAYIDRILRGAKPGDLPVQAPTKFELVINLKTAKTLGLAVPRTLVARADEVIE